MGAKIGIGLAAVVLLIGLIWFLRDDAKDDGRAEVNTENQTAVIETQKVKNVVTNRPRSVGISNSRMHAETY